MLFHRSVEGEKKTMTEISENWALPCLHTYRAPSYGQDCSILHPVLNFNWLFYFNRAKKLSLNILKWFLYIFLTSLGLRMLAPIYLQQRLVHCKFKCWGRYSGRSACRKSERYRKWIPSRKLDSFLQRSGCLTYLKLPVTGHRYAGQTLLQLWCTGR